MQIRFNEHSRLTTLSRCGPFRFTEPGSEISEREKKSFFPIATAKKTGGKKTRRGELSCISIATLAKRVNTNDQINFLGEEEGENLDAN